LLGVAQMKHHAYKPNRPIKMEDVAKLANVSPSTVSRVLSGSSLVASETRKRVLEAIKILNYKPNRLGRNLRKLTSKIVMVVFPDITNPFFARIIQGAEEVARKRGYYVLLGDTRNNLELEEEFIELAKERLVDGVILATARIPREKILSLSLQVPLVLACEYLEGSWIPTVSIDNIKAAYEATEYLIKLGHKRIAFINGPDGIILSKDRLEGYKKACEENNIQIDQHLIEEGDFTVESGYKIMKRFLLTSEKPTAVFAANDEMAVGAIKAVKEGGYNVPADISVIGFDDIPLCRLVDPQLSTISQPTYEIGKQAMEMLLDIIEDKSLEEKRVILPHKLIIRESCKPLF